MMARRFGYLPNQWAAYARLQASRLLVPGDACLRGTTFGLLACEIDALKG
jgi:hypothetical protein